MTQPISNPDVLSLISLLDLQKPRLKKNELWALCLNPYHHDSNPTNFSINLSTGACFCFACQYQNNVVNLLADKNNSYNFSSILWNRIRENYLTTGEIYIPEPPLDNSFISLYKKNGLSQYAINRLGSAEIVEKYGIYQDDDKNPVFFVSDWQGNKRAVWVREYGKYILIHPSNSKRDGWLFGMELPPTDIVILTEGFFDACWVHMQTGYKAVCGMGTYLSKKQIQNLGKMGKVYIMFDGDDAGRLGRQKIHSLTKGMDFRYCGNYLGDPDSKTSKQLYKIIDTAKTWYQYTDTMVMNSQI